MGYSLSKKNPLYELIADYTVSGSATSSVTLNGFTLTKDEDYILVSTIVNTYASVIGYFLFANGITSGYYEQYMTATGTTIQAFRSADATYCLCEANDKTEAITKIKLTNSGYFCYQSNSNRKFGGSTMDLNQIYGTSTFTASSLTSLVIRADDYGDAVNAIGVGSRFQLYRIRNASKIADVTISGSATTTVNFDLSATPITKGSEFMLCFHHSQDTGSNSLLYLFKNNDTTLTNYYKQYVYASLTTIGAGRENNPQIDNGSTSSQGTVLGYVKIKVTNNGYFVYQSDYTYRVGSSAPELVKMYGTSTNTLTSVTSLTLSASTTNGIGIGTRFQLYKLK